MCVTASMRYVVSVSSNMADRVAVGRADAVHLVTARIVGVMSPAVATREAEEGHGGHAGGSENHAEDVKVHLY
jgi:hypothetical protein